MLRRAHLPTAVVTIAALLWAPPALADAEVAAPANSASADEPAGSDTTDSPSDPQPSDPQPSDPPPTDPEPEPTEVPVRAGLGPAGKKVRFSTTLGRSSRGRAIRAWHVGAAKPRQVLVVLGQMHGDEKAGKATAHWVRNRLRPKRGTAVWIVPTMNPDGDAAGRRQNARGVDLNRNWPTSGWQQTPRGSRYWSGPKPGSEPETKAMMAFLRRVKPDYIASIHQPLHGIGKTGEDVAWEKRLARNLNLPRKYFGVSQGKGVSPTLTGWYNHRLGRHGTATTIEYGASPGTRYRTRTAGLGIARAAKVR